MIPDRPGVWTFRYEDGSEEDILIIWEAMGPRIWDLVAHGDEIPGNSLIDFVGHGKWVSRKSDLPEEFAHLGEKVD
jgi:hypothetical protein